MKHKGIFVTGTDTGVGKTVVVSVLTALLRRAGIDAVPMKPVQTGCRMPRRGLNAPDLDFALGVAGLAPAPHEKALMCPSRWSTPCSPHLAARREGGRIRVRDLSRSFRALALKHEFVVVEGAGGAMVPLNDKAVMADLVQALGIPVLVVARPGLGTLNHTLLTLNELRRRSVCIAGVVFNESAPSVHTFLEEDNRLMLEKIGKVPVLGWVRYDRSMADRDLIRKKLPMLARGEFMKIVRGIRSICGAE